MNELPAGWSWTTIGEVAGTIRGVTYQKADARSKAQAGYLPLLRATNITSELLLDGEMVYVPEGVVKPIQRLRVGDLVLAASSGSVSVVGKGAMLRREWTGTFGAFCTALRPSDRVLPAYLALFASSPAIRQRWSDAARGTNINNLKSGDLAGTPLPLPPLVEQRRIVDLLEDHLSRLDAAAASLDHAERLCAGLRESAVRQVLTGDQLAGPRTGQAPSAEGVEDGTLAGLPAGWKWLRLHEVADVVGGVTKDAGRQSDPAFLEVPYLRVANVQRGRLALDKITKIRVPASKASALRLIPGDVLMNEGGDRDKLGRGWVWEGQIDDCIHQNHVFRARVVEQRLHPKLLSWAANSIGGRWCERNGKQSVNLASISLKRIRLMPVPVPPVELQEELVLQIEETLSACDRLEGAIYDQRRRLHSLRRTLLAAAFTGELNVLSDRELVHV